MKDFYAEFAESLSAGKVDHVIDLAGQFLSDDFKHFEDGAFVYDRGIFIERMKKKKTEDVKGVNRHYDIHDIYPVGEELVVKMTVQSWTLGKDNARIYEDDSECVDKFSVKDEPKSFQLKSCVCKTIPYELEDGAE